MADHYVPSISNKHRAKIEQSYRGMAAMPSPFFLLTQSAIASNLMLQSMRGWRNWQTR